MAEDVRRAERARACLEYLSERAPGGDWVPIQEIWDRMLERVPLTEHEQERNTSGRMRGETDWRFASSLLVSAGWLRKKPDGSGLWSITREGLEALEALDGDALLSEAQSRYSAARAEQRAALEQSLPTRWVSNDASARRVLDAADVIVERALRHGESIFSAGREIWSDAVVSRLYTRWAEAERIDGASFVENLEHQLSDASDDERLLMAEIATIHLLPLSSVMGHAKKTERISTILGFMEHTVEIPRVFDEAFGGGAFNPGPAMTTGVNRAVTIILAVARAWVALSDDERDRMLADPIACRDFVLQVPGEAFPTQRYSLLYLMHPGFFGPIVAKEHRTMVRDAFLGEIGGRTTGDVDRDLHEIVLALQQKEEGPLQFYREPLLSRWQSSRRAPVVDPEPDPVIENHRDFDPRGFSPADVSVRAIADRLLLDESWLGSLVAALHRRGQIILYGPPGTGKTFVARALSDAIGADASRVKRIQFHPSYTYEDFFAGYRPHASDTGQLSFQLKLGPLRKLADDARRNPELTHVLMIDEINRANLSKVFGELYYLLEYRDDPIEVLYAGSGEDGGNSFRLPENVVIIGTMNTADRSIALLDSAMRRRFSFFELHPDVEPLAGILHRWEQRYPQPQPVAQLFDLLNATIGDREDRIGPSHLLRENPMSENDLAAAWDESIIPLLEDRHLGTGVDVRATYGLGVLRSRLARDPSSLSDQ